MAVPVAAVARARAHACAVAGAVPLARAIAGAAALACTCARAVAGAVALARACAAAILRGRPALERDKVSLFLEYQTSK